MVRKRWIRDNRLSNICIIWLKGFNSKCLLGYGKDKLRLIIGLRVYDSSQVCYRIRVDGFKYFRVLLETTRYIRFRTSFKPLGEAKTGGFLIFFLRGLRNGLTPEIVKISFPPPSLDSVYASAHYRFLNCRGAYSGIFTEGGSAPFHWILKTPWKP